MTESNDWLTDWLIVVEIYCMQTRTTVCFRIHNMRDSAAYVIVEIYV